MALVTERWRVWLASTVPAVELASPASERALSLAEQRLGIVLPRELRSLLAESNGVSYGLVLDSGERIGPVGNLVWALEEIIAQNEALRADDAFGQEMSRLLVFSNAGVDGILFGHRITPSGVSPQVLAWNRAEPTVSVADSLRDYLARWPSGDLTV